MKDLNKHVVKQQAAQWEGLGLELGLERYHIDNITKDHPNESVICCRKMLQEWLDIDPSASWRKLHDAVRRIRSPTPGSTSTVSSADSTGSVFMICSSDAYQNLSMHGICQLAIFQNFSKDRFTII